MAQELGNLATGRRRTLQALCLEAVGRLRERFDDVRFGGSLSVGRTGVVGFGVVGPGGKVAGPSGTSPMTINPISS